MDPSVRTAPTARAATIRAAALAPLVRCIAESGIDADGFLGRYGIARQNLTDPYALVPLAQYVDVFENAAIVLKDPNLGLRLGMRIRPADIGPMGVLFSLSPTLKAGFTRLSNHVTALQGCTQSSLFEAGKDMVWTYRISDQQLWPRRQDAEFTLAAVSQLVRSSFAANWQPLEVQFEHGEHADRALLQRIFRAPVLFHQSANRVVMSRADCQRVYRPEDVGLSVILERHIADLIGQSREPEPLVDRLRMLIGLWLGQRPITVSALAADLRMSPRSLQRRLACEGTSLRALVRESRIQLAQSQLRRSGTPVSQVASNLGYADGTVLWRAFRTWTGQDPSAWRKDGGPDRLE